MDDAKDMGKGTATAEIGGLCEKGTEKLGQGEIWKEAAVQRFGNKQT